MNKPYRRRAPAPTGRRALDHGGGADADAWSPDWFLYGEASPAQRGFLDEVTQIGLDFVSGAARDDRVLRYADNDTLRALFAQPLPRRGRGFTELLALLRDKVAGYSVAQQDPRYLAFPDVATSVATVAADMLAGFLNQNLIAVDRSAPAATFVELQLLLWLRELVGFPTTTLEELPNLQGVGGMWTPGGNLSNYLAVLVALNTRFPEVREEGVAAPERRPVILQAKQIAHFSYEAAAAALGLGSKAVRWTDAASDFTTDPESAARTIAACGDDVAPFMLVGVAGNCRTAGLDNLRRLREVCDEHGLWLHIDACHGGSLLFSERLRTEHLAGIELADSVSLDPHKAMFVTYPSSYVLFRQPEHLSVFSRYQHKVRDSGCLDLGLITPFLGSRGFQSLKLWLLVQHLGTDGLAEAVERRHAANARMGEVMRRTGLFVAFNESLFYRVAFVFCPAELRPRIAAMARDPAARPRLRALISRYTGDFCEALYREGAVSFDLASMQDLADTLGLGADGKYSTMGMVVGHPSLPDDVVAGIEADLQRVGAELLPRMRADIDREGAEPIPSHHSGPAGW